MIKFVDKEFLLENNDPCVLVIDADLQGAWESDYLEQVKFAFPRVYQIYKSICLTNTMKEGSSILIEDSGYKIGILFTKKHRKEKDIIKLQDNFSKALTSLLAKIPSDEWIYSPIMGRREKLFASYLTEINRLIAPLKYNWYIYRKDESC